MNNFTEENLKRLIAAAKKGLDILIEELERPLEREELQDDKARNAVKAKRECFKDAQDMIFDIAKLEAKLNEEEYEDEDEGDFSAGLAEKFAGK